MPFQRFFELLLEIVLEAMTGQTPEQKKTMWDFYIADVKWWRKAFKLDEAAKP